VSFIIGDDGSLEVDPDTGGHPIREGNARFVRELAFRLEQDQQMFESLSESSYRYKKQIADLQGRVAMLEELLLGSQAAA